MPRDRKAAGFLVPKDFDRKKRGTVLILLRRQRRSSRSRVHKERYTPTARARARQRRAGLHPERKEEKGTKISFQGQRSPRPSFLALSPSPFLRSTRWAFQFQTAQCRTAKSCSDLPSTRFHVSGDGSMDKEIRKQNQVQGLFIFT